MRAWRPGHAAYLRRHALRSGPATSADWWTRIEAAASWLGRAQEVGADGGVAGRYSLARGWTSSYPETTGYLIPTFLRLASNGFPGFEERAFRATEFLLGLQLPSGAFPGGEIAENLTEPSVFNTGQILHGLVTWARHSDDAAVREAAAAAGAWMVSVQEEDGCWRRHVYRGLPTTYTAHASCWLAEAGRQLEREDFLAAADRHLDWVLGHQDPETGWFDLSGFTVEDHRLRRSVTHTIAYTVWGVLIAADILGRADGIRAATRAADEIGARLEADDRLAGVLDHTWNPRVDWTCVTGNCQMALVWQWLDERDRVPDATERPGGARASWAIRALDLAAGAQALNNRNPGIRGALPGSDPIWGDYIYGAFPNWAAKFFIDAHLNAVESAN